MARKVNPVEYEQKRQEILTAALAFTGGMGYDKMTIADIIKKLNISKGAFYHYFDSKEQMTSALIRQTIQITETMLTPIVMDDSLNAVQKLHKFYDSMVQWKGRHKIFYLGLLKSWYRDENAILRYRITSEWKNWFANLVDRIVAQGIREGSFNMLPRAYASDIIIALMQGQGERVATYMLETLANSQDYPRNKVAKGFADIVENYNEALNRILGLPSGTIRLIETKLLMEWWDAACKMQKDGWQPKEMDNALSTSGMA